MIFRVFAAFALLVAPVAALADTLVDNVNGVTIDEAGRVQTFAALVFGEDGRIVSVHARKDKLPKTRYRIDGQGRTMIPGLIDAHLHVMGLGFASLTLDLSGTRSLAEAQAKIAAYAAANPDRAWIVGRQVVQPLRLHHARNAHTRRLTRRPAARHGC